MFYSHGSIWDTFIKKLFFANFLQIHGSSWDTFIKKFPRKNKKLLCNYKKNFFATIKKSSLQQQKKVFLSQFFF